MKKFIRKQLLPITGLVIGALSGYLYWKFAGCNSGSCAITSSPVNSSIYGAVMGGLFFSIFQKDKNKSQ